MPFVLKKRTPVQEKTIPVDLGPAGSLDLIVRPTTATEELGATLSSILDNVDAVVLRVLNSIVGWRGVQDEHGHEVPFSREALADLMRSLPPFAVVSVMTAVTGFYNPAPQPPAVAPPATTEEK
ncbi:MAG: hypothetical protein IT428_32515 [Planctomycetaceae bacterium]|nr:hypothetical protein [Planctomycetaceae bacterium]